MNYIVLDLEFNQFFDFKYKSLSNPIKNCPFEIIQIGAIKLDENFNIISQKNFYIQSNIYIKIHPFVEKITGITEDTLADKPSFPEIYSDFIEFISGENNVICTWGGSDINILLSNIDYYKLNPMSLPNYCINVQQISCSYLNHTHGVTIGLKNAVEKLNIPLDIDFHNALNDAIYTSKILKIVKNKISKSNFQIIKKEKSLKKKEFNSYKLYTSLEKELGRKITKKEKEIARKIYVLGRNKTFDYK